MANFELANWLLLWKMFTNVHAMSIAIRILSYQMWYISFGAGFPAAKHNHSTSSTEKRARGAFHQLNGNSRERDHKIERFIELTYIIHRLDICPICYSLQPSRSIAKPNDDDDADDDAVELSSVVRLALCGIFFSLLAKWGKTHNIFTYVCTYIARGTMMTTRRGFEVKNR